MTEFASLRDALDQLRIEQDEYSRIVQRFVTAQTIDVKELWAEIADVRDDLHGVANRVESLFSALKTTSTMRLHERDDDAA